MESEATAKESRRGDLEMKLTAGYSTLGAHFGSGHKIAKGSIVEYSSGFSLSSFVYTVCPGI